MEAHDERLSLIAEQRPELTAAFVADDDYDFAFNLQMQEAMNASLAAQPFNLESFDLDIPEDGVMEAVTAHFLAEEMERFERYRSDGEVAESWMKDESFRVYCKGLVSEETVGGVKKKLAGIGLAICGPSSEDVVFEARKCLTGGGEMSGEIAEVEALIEGLHAALTLGLQGIDIFCDINSLYQYVTGKLAAREGKITMLFDQVNLLWKKFTFCGPNLVEKKDIKYAYELARDAIAYQLTQPEGSSSGVTREMIYCPYPNCSSPMSKNEVCTFSATGFSICSKCRSHFCINCKVPWHINMTCSEYKRSHPYPPFAEKGKLYPPFAEKGKLKSQVETCLICLEDIEISQMLSIHGCQHRFCLSCMKQHVKAKLLQGLTPRCPNVGCKIKLKIEFFRKFLTPELLDIMSQRIKEASVPVTLKVYCPYPKCWALMSKPEVCTFSASGFSICMNCRGHFCINCKVPWHADMTCSDYKRLLPYLCPEEAMLKSLATKKLWRQCAKCNNMIELKFGCYHINCRCGYEFCYTCGAEWKNKKPTCRCCIWDERNILYAQQN